VIKIVGDSMYPLLRDGYLVLIDRRPGNIRNGDVVVSVHKGENTIKRYYREGRQITLRAENYNVPPVVIVDDEEDSTFQIFGKATTIVEAKIE